MSVDQKRFFEKLSLYCDRYAEQIPVTFILGRSECLPVCLSVCLSVSLYASLITGRGGENGEEGEEERGGGGRGHQGLLSTFWDQQMKSLQLPAANEQEMREKGRWRKGGMDLISCALGADITASEVCV